MSEESREQSRMMLLLEDYRNALYEHEVVRAAEDLYDCLEPKIRLYIYGKIHSVDAQDVTQETMKAIFTNLPTFSGNTKASLFSWSFTIANNKINDHRRKHYSRKMEPLPPEEIAKFVDETKRYMPLSPEDKIDCDEAMDLLAKAKPECREYLWNRFIVDMDYSELADQYNLDYDAMRMRIGRCLEVARSIMTA